MQKTSFRLSDLANTRISLSPRPQVGFFVALTRLAGATEASAPAGQAGRGSESCLWNPTWSLA